MAYEQKEGTATMFQNPPEPGSRRPRFTITGMYKGELVKLAFWNATTPEGVNKKDKNGNVFFTGTIGPDTFRQGQQGGAGSSGASGGRTAPADEEMFT